MNEIKDILNDLEIDIDLSSVKKEIKVDKEEEKSSNDILSEDKKFKDINIRNKKKLFVLKNKTRIFDSVLKNKRLKNISLVKNKKESINFKKNIQNINFLKIFNFLKINKQNNFKKSNLKFEKNITKKINSNKNQRFFIWKKFVKKISISFFVIIIFYFINWLFLQHYINSWYSKLLAISNWNLNDINIENQLNEVKQDFIVSDILIKPFLIFPSKNIKDLYFIIKWGKSLSYFLNDSYNYYISLNNNLLSNWLENINLIDLLNNSEYIYLNFSNNLEATIFYYDKVWNLFNNDIKIKFEKGRFILKKVYNYLTLINRNFDIIKNIFWDDSEKNYLILFQNNDEIRPTWWFIWSMWHITINKWIISNFKNDDIYAYEWEINKNYEDKIKAPEWINKVTDILWIRDSNYKIWFIESSYQMKYFLDLMDKNIDWIIYINQNIILDLLDITWDIFFEQLWENINSDNFSVIFSTLVESKKFKVWLLGTPKKILFDFWKIFINKLITEWKYSQYSKIIFNNISSRDIVLNSFNSDENSLLWKLWLDWNISYMDTLDFSYPVFMSVWWSKTDRYMIRNFSKNIKINDDCSIDTDLKIIQKHHFTSDEENYLNILFDKFEITDKNIVFIQWKAINKQFIQVVLPKNAIIKNPWKYIIDENLNNKVVKFYTNTERLETINNTISYKILNEKCLDYDFNFYKQPWIKSYDLDINYNWIKIQEIWLKWDYNFSKKITIF